MSYSLKVDFPLWLQLGAQRIDGERRALAEEQEGVAMPSDVQQKEAAPTLLHIAMMMMGPWSHADYKTGGSNNSAIRRATKRDQAPPNIVAYRNDDQSPRGSAVCKSTFPIVFDFT